MGCDGYRSVLMAIGIRIGNGGKEMVVASVFQYVYDAVHVVACHLFCGACFLCVLLLSFCVVGNVTYISTSTCPSLPVRLCHRFLSIDVRGVDSFPFQAHQEAQTPSCLSLEHNAFIRFFESEFVCELLAASMTLWCGFLYVCAKWIYLL